jgi:CHAT domain-containing protein
LVPVHRPEIEEEFGELAGLREQFNLELQDEAVKLAATASPKSEIVHWQAIFQQVHVHRESGKWTWNSEWAPFYYPRSDDFWKTLYDVIYAKLIPEFEQRGIEHLVISPDGSISPLPHHLLRDASNRRLCDRFRVSYSPNILGLTTCLAEEQSDVRTLPAVLVADPKQSIRFAAWECVNVASVLGTSATILDLQDACVDRIREACAGAGIFHFSGHALFDWSAPEASYLRVAAKGKMGLAEIRSLQLNSNALVFLSACGSARTGHSVDRCESLGIVNAFLDAGAATVIGTLWPVEGAATALVAHWFYRAWYAEGKGRLESLNEATARLRDATRSECENILSDRVRFRGDKPFADEYFWGAFALYGAW